MWLCIGRPGPPAVSPRGRRRKTLPCDAQGVTGGSRDVAIHRSPWGARLTATLAAHLFSPFASGVPQITGHGTSCASGPGRARGTPNTSRPAAVDYRPAASVNARGRNLFRSFSRSGARPTPSVGREWDLAPRAMLEPPIHRTRSGRDPFWDTWRTPKTAARSRRRSSVSRRAMPARSRVGWIIRGQETSPRGKDTHE